MHRAVLSLVVTAALLVTPAIARDHGVVKPPMAVIDKIVAGMPKTDTQQVRVIAGTLRPGARTPYHTHRFPVTVYVIAGTFTLEIEGRRTVRVKAGEAFVEPANVKITGYNRSSTEPMTGVAFYVSDPHTPFLDIVR